MESNKRKKIKKIFAYFFGFYFLVFGALISCENVSAATTTLPKEEYTPVKQVISADPLKFTPQIKIPGTAIDGTVEVGKQVGTKMTSTLLPSYIGAFYKYGLTVTGLLATVILMAGGIIWLTSAGNESKVKQAKEMIFGSLAGVLLLFSSYIILETINPELVKLRPIESQSIDEVNLDIVCCQTTFGAWMMKADECVEMEGSRMKNYYAEDGKCIKRGCCSARNDNDYQKVAACTDSFKSQCPGEVTYRGHTNEFAAQPCSEIRACQAWRDNGGIFNSCENAKDADECRVAGKTGFCYSGQCYTTAGKNGEQCGNDNGICKDKATYGSCISDDWFGRSCVNDPDTFCCKGGKTEYGGGGGNF